MLTLDTHPDRYRHWRLEVDPPVAVLTLDVDEGGGLGEGYALKMNSYDLGVDVELHDAVQRLRFEHPDVGAVLIRSGKDRIFCAGANIQMLGLASHAGKVNFCKFTNETRNAIEDATTNSGQRYLCALNGPASGGGYELALACDHIMLIDDGSSTVSLPEVPLLGVLPGTGGLTRLVDKRRVRRDLADLFATTAEGVRGRRAVEWGLVDEIVPRSRFEEVARERAAEAATARPRPPEARGMELTPLPREVDEGRISYPHVSCVLDRDRGIAEITIAGPRGDEPGDPASIRSAGAEWWPLAMAREGVDLLFILRSNFPELGLLLLRTAGDPGLDAVRSVDRTLLEQADHWLVRETTLLLKRTLWRLETSSRSVFALVEPGSCFGGSLFEFALAADRIYMLSGEPEDGGRPPRVALTGMNLGPLPMGNGLTRLQARFLGGPEHLDELERRLEQPLDAEEALELGLVTVAPDAIDWDEEVRVAVEERASFSPDALTGMEANLRFCGPETLETKIFGRLSVWQNWIFQRPNASGDRGGLKTYGTGVRPRYDRGRV